MRQWFPELFLSAQKVMKVCRVEPGETAVVFADTGREPAIIEAFHAAALAAGAETLLVTMETRPLPLMNPPTAAITALAAADIVFDLATEAWLYTEATNTILAAGTRMLQVLVGRDTIIHRPPEEFIAAREAAARRILEACETYRITSPYGTDLRMQRGDRPIHTQGGFVDHPGDWDSLAVCLGSFAPPEDKADGTLAFYGTMDMAPGHMFITEKPILTKVEGGRITWIDTSHREGRRLSDFLASWNDPGAYVIAHTGFGLDHRARLHPSDPGNWESYLAGVNVAFGANNIPQLGGKTVSPSHIDSVLLGVDLEINGRKVIRQGSFVEGTGLEN